MDDSPTIKLGEVKSRLGLLAERPVAGPRRVVVLADASDMGRESQNAMLRTLEESPPAAALILLARTSEGILPTVASRCRVIPIAAAMPSELQRNLVQGGLSDACARFLAFAASDDAGLALALSLREDLTELQADAVRFVTGALGPAPLPPLELVERYQARLASAEAAQQWLACVGGVLRAVIAGAGDRDARAAMQAFSNEGAAALADVPVAGAAALAERIGEVRQAIARHAAARLALEAAVLSISG
jgi:hypothetical protein